MKPFDESQPLVRHWLSPSEINRVLARNDSESHNSDSFNLESPDTRLHENVYAVCRNAIPAHSDTSSFSRTAHSPFTMTSRMPSGGSFGDSYDD